jgi:hypothetical protein
MFLLKLYKNLLESLVNLLDSPRSQMSSKVTTLAMPKPRTRKVSDTTKYSLDQRFEIWVRYQRYLEYNKSNPKDRMTFSQLVQGINHSFGTHKSPAAIMLVIKGMEPLTDNLPSSSNTQEFA